MTDFPYTIISYKMFTLNFISDKIIIIKVNGY